MRDFKQQVTGATVSGTSDIFDFQAEDYVGNIDVALNVTASAGTTPTLDITVETSFDKEAWFNTGIAFGQATGITKELLSVAKAGGFIRFNYIVAGGGGETFDFDLHAVVKG